MFPLTNRFGSFACASALLTAVGCTDDGAPNPGLDDDYDTASDDRGIFHANDVGAIPDDNSVDTCETGGIPDPPLPRPPDGTYYGTTYAELNVAWFQWILSQPRIGNPGFDPTGAACASGQSGDVWFLAGSFNQTVVERTCTIPPGKAIFFPILNAFTTCYFGDASCTEKELPASLESTFDEVIDMFATIDGCDVGDPVDYRVHATEFSVTLPPGNVFQAYGIPIEGLVEDLYGGGYWMLFDPLPAGEHTITFGGVFPGTWANDNTYTLTVE